MKTGKVFFVLVIACVFGLSATIATAAPIFSEDFDSYADGSNLSGQGGWVGDIMYVNNGTYMTGSKVLDGRDDIPTKTISISRNGFGSSLDSSAISTMTFDAYATTTAPLTHNSGVGLDNIAGGTLVAWWPVKAQSGVFSWSFAPTGLVGSGNYHLVAGGYNEVVSMSIVVDGVANEVYGKYDFGSGGTGETPHYSVTDAKIEELNSAVIYADYRSPQNATTPHGDTFSGGEFDNMVVVPEPASIIVLTLGGLAFIRRKLRTI